MGDSFSILYPTGLVMDVGVQSPVNGQGNYGSVVVSQPIPGLGFQSQSFGTFALAQGQLSGHQGTIEAQIVTGVQGSARTILVLSTSDPATTNSNIAVALDSLNRPYAMVYSALGTQIALSQVQARPQDSNVPMTIRLVWNTLSPVLGGDYIALEINNTLFLTWATGLTAAWTPIVPSVAIVGDAISGLSLSGFNGTLKKVQVSNTPVLSTQASTTSLVLGRSQATIVGTGSVTATAKAVHKATAVLVGQATVSTR